MGSDPKTPDADDSDEVDGTDTEILSEGWGLETVEIVPEELGKTSPEPPREADAYLTCLSGDRAGTMHKLEGAVVVGRSSDANLRLIAAGISRRHLQVRVTPGGIVLRDLSSRNGTYVNGHKVEKPIVLEDGDKIRVGDTVVLKFSYADTLDAEFQQRMYDSAIRDPLTGLHNRRFLMDRLRSEFSYSVRHKTPLAMVILDLDHFKQVNDTYGHLVGDAVLRSFGKLAGKSCRTEDVVARYGGEEFALVLRGLTEFEAVAAADRLRVAVGGERLASDHADLRVTVSAGAAAFPSAEIESPEALIAAADKALYHSKGAGRNRVTGYSQLDTA